MKYLLAAICLGFGGCAVPPGKRIDITLKNETGRRVTFWAAAGIFGKEITLEPGETWDGWIPTAMGVSKATIRLR